jgi:hypothetical protein
MSDAAYQSYADAQNRQYRRNEARHIRTRVTEARKSPQSSGPRWPFELLQNALDAGPRDGRTTVSIRLECRSDAVLFHHDGAPFNSGDLAALLSGGSNKEFESVRTTGRFGTGFLVTHVLAEQTRLSALLQVNGGHEQVELALDRSGDEDAILANIDACDAAIKQARQIPDISAAMSAIFRYPTDGSSSLRDGVEAFRKALPYVFGTRPLLGTVACVNADGSIETWEPSDIVIAPTAGGYVQTRDLLVDRGSAHPRQSLRVLRISTQPDFASAALVVLEGSPGAWGVRFPDSEAPRLYREYPVRGSTFLPVNFIMDGKFDVDQERHHLLMQQPDRTLIGEALGAAVLMIQLAVTEEWAQRHLLSVAQAPVSAFDPNSADEKQWWHATLSRFASRLAALPLIRTEESYRPAVGAAADVAAFPVPRTTLQAAADETDIARMLPIMACVEHLHPPVTALAEDWASIAAGWKSLGVPVRQVALKDVADAARLGATTLDQLRLAGDKLQWLARFLDLVGECWHGRESPDTTILDKLLPSQKGALCGPKVLLRDSGISEELKNICEAVGLGIRDKLLSVDIRNADPTQQLKHLESMLATAIPEARSENDILDECIRHLEDKLKEDTSLLPGAEQCFSGSVRLLHHLWTTKEAAAESLAKRVPIATSNRMLVRWGKDRMQMAPISKWNPAAQPFSPIYPENRVLNAAYAGDPARAIPDVVAALVKWGVCHADPLTRHTPAELKEKKLASLAARPAETAGVTVTGKEFAYIAMLHPEVINRCQEDPEKAKALLGLVLCYIVRFDESWLQTTGYTGRKAGTAVEVTLHGALWLGELTTRAWVPIQGEDGAFSQVVPSAAVLNEMIDAHWLADNPKAIELLSSAFGFDALEVRLLGIAPDEAGRQRLRNGLAKLVETLGANPDDYVELARQIAEKKKRDRDIERLRNLGLAVQEAVRAALESRNLELELVDVGFDYRVTVDSVADPAYQMKVGSYLLEVKATTSGKPRMTPTQAETAAKNKGNYALCVVDLRSVDPARLDSPWTAADVEPIARIKPGIGDTVGETYALVDQARAELIGIRNEETLRYEVPEEIWTTGVSIPAWAASLAASAGQRSG